MTNWVFVCEKNELDLDDLMRFDYGNNTYCIYHINDGFYATDGMCTHEDVHLEGGLIMDNEIECPMHQGIFNIKTGKVIQDPPCDDLRTYQVKVENDKIYIELD
tara:strand:+ start:113 stop:424 length:312 start_codon:yes stop_codon:yes gene_type:complete